MMIDTQRLLDRELRRLAMQKHEGPASMGRALCMISGFVIWLAGLFVLARINPELSKIFIPMLTDGANIWQDIFLYMLPLAVSFIPGFYFMFKIDKWQTHEYNKDIVELRKQHGIPPEGLPRPHTNYAGPK